MARSMVANAGSEKQVKAAGEMTKRERQRWDSQLGLVAGLEEGRAVLHRILKDRCGIWELSFSADPYRTAFNEGSRNVGLWLLAEINRVDAGAIQRMTAEAVQRETQRPENKPRTDDPIVEAEDDGN